MNRRQAKILIRAIQDDKEIVLPKKHYHVRGLTEAGYLEEVLHEVPKATDDNKDKIGVIMRWIVTGAVSMRTIDDKVHIILYKPTDKAKEWLQEKAQSNRNKDKRLLQEAGYGHQST